MRMRSMRMQSDSNSRSGCILPANHSLPGDTNVDSVEVDSADVTVRGRVERSAGMEHGVVVHQQKIIRHPLMLVAE